MLLIVQLVVPVAVPPPPWLFDQTTSVTPTLSEANPLTSSVPEEVPYEELEVGLLIEIVGGK